MAAKIETRLHIDAPLESGTAVGLDHAASHFLRSVLRLKPGAMLAVFNGRDGEWSARIDGIGKGWCSLEVIELRRRPEPEPDLWLVFAPIKRARLDFVAEKAVELGCSLLQPVFTRYTDVSRVNSERLAANAREAAEQCERMSLPAVRDVISLDALIDSWPADRRMLLCAESGVAQPVADALHEVRAEDSQAGRAPWAVMTGPEGGFTKGELDALTKLPFVTSVGLGPRILRADTAAVAALACWQAVLGDWEKRPPHRTDA
ncbi:16S rRNA (uracil(1498)-N(3))-methyltransferase [Pelagibius sp. Alg239-R121]|uniref:16S rRNA (uracil(1498)-N(3))-methyltransferase n=1 Tax=Pelagibius sp. Alg239-R121 TaxID=2993448 RepID=UPI0024A7422F|nr:16S rRNA (uracil(1498)-N(3))-methyltransferase [Pelagibius sp. Alg239-R121]